MTFSTQVVIRETLLKLIGELKPAEHEDVQQFNMSSFYPSEVTLPLTKMFGFLIQKLLPDQLEKILEIESLFPEVPTYHEDATDSIIQFVDKVIQFENLAAVFEKQSKELNERISNYFQENYWDQTIWKELETKINEEKELKLLKEICFNIYESAKDIFEKEQKDFLTRMISNLESLENQYLLQKGKWEANRNVFNNFRDAYEKFLQSKIIYKHPEKKIQVEFKVSEITNDPFNGVFDIGTSSSFLIRTGLQPLNDLSCSSTSVNSNQMQIMIIPKFLLELQKTVDGDNNNNHVTGLEQFYDKLYLDKLKWADDASVGIFYFSNNLSYQLLGYSRYQTLSNLDDLSSNSLYQNWTDSQVVVDHQQIRDRTEHFIHYCLFPCSIPLWMLDQFDVSCQKKSVDNNANSTDSGMDSLSFLCNAMFCPVACVFGSLHLYTAMAAIGCSRFSCNCCLFCCRDCMESKDRGFFKNDSVISELNHFSFRYDGCNKVK
jgi:hypothetical protein